VKEQLLKQKQLSELVEHMKTDLLNQKHLEMKWKNEYKVGELEKIYDAMSPEKGEEEDPSQTLKDPNKVFSHGLKTFYKESFPITEKKVQKSSMKSAMGSTMRSNISPSRQQEMKSRERRLSGRTEESSKPRELDEGDHSPCFSVDKSECEITIGTSKIKIGPDSKCSACSSKILQGSPVEFFVSLEQREIKCTRCENQISSAANDDQFIAPMLKFRVLPGQDQWLLNREIRLHSDSVQVENQSQKDWNKKCENCQKDVKTGAMYLLA
jgi:DNA-directed RNA polymerase subunit RPC12/RpoP